MITLVLVHSPFTSTDVWSLVAERMSRAGYGVRAPSLHHALADPGPLYPRLVQTISEVADEQESIVLVAHSGAGPLMAAVVATTPTVRGVVFVDAGLPQPGVKWRDTAPPDLVARLLAGSEHGRLPAWSTWFGPSVLSVVLPDEQTRARFLATEPRAPVALIDEPLPADELPSGVPAAYLRLSAAYDAELTLAQRLGWPTRTADLGHLGMLTSPDRVATLLAELIGAIT